MQNDNATALSLDAYLQRIGYNGTPALDRDTLFGIHRAHLTAISYENLDIHLGRTLSLDLAEIFDKIVLRGRGGWCYEMNTLLAWALREIGFDVNVLGAAVGVETPEDRQNMDHMALQVLLDGEPWLLDTGFGNAFLDPLPLREGIYKQAYHTYGLERDGDYWRFKNLGLEGPGFDFLPQARTIEEFASRCDWSQTSPESGFVMKTVCHRLHMDYSILSLRGAVLTTVNANGKSHRIIDNLEAYKHALIVLFSLNLSDAEITTLWEKVWPAHLAWIQGATT